MIVNIENLKPVFPMIYLAMAAVIAIVGYKLGVPEVVIGAIVGAALSRVKIPAPNGK
jgi:hypothetical protein